MGLVAVPASAAPGDESASSSQFVSGSLLDAIDLSSIAGVAGTEASNSGDPAPVIDTTDLDITALSAINVTIADGVSLPLGDLLALGAVNQYSEARDAGVSLAASGAVSDAGVVDTSGDGTFPADASLNLMALLPETAALDTASLTLGAVTGVAAFDAAQADLATACADLAAPDHCRDYQIASATINVGSPLLGDIVTTANGALTTLGTTLEALEDEVVDGLLAGVTDSLDLLSSLLPGVSLVSNDLAVDITADLAGALNAELNEVRTAGGVTLDLSAGTIAVDLEQLVDVNNLPPNTPLLSATTLTAIGDQVEGLLTQLQGEINAALDGVLDSVTVSISGGVCLLEVAGLCTAGLDIAYDGTLGDLLDGTESLALSGTGTLGLLDPIIDPLLATVTSGLTDLVQPLVTSALSTAGSAIEAVITTAAGELSPVFGLIGDVVSVNINVQEDDGAGTYTEIATQITLIGGNGATVNLGKASVGANSIADVVYDTAILVDPGTIQQGESTTISGSGFAAEESVSLTIDGAEVGPVMTDVDGNFTFDHMTDADAATGTFEVVATGEASQTPATGSLTIEAADAVYDTAIMVDPGTIQQGESTTISGTGFAAEESASLTIDGAEVGPVMTDVDGTFSFLHMTDADAATGTFEVVATGEVSQTPATGSLTVEAAGTGADPDANADADSTSAANADADVDGSNADENTNAAASASASANADDDSNAAAQVAAQAAAQADASTTATAAADADATAAAQVAANADASSDASTDVSSEANASAQVAAQAAAQADATSASNADATSAADGNAGSAAAVAANADSSSDASVAAAANADSDVDGSNADENTNAAASASASANADDDSNAAAQVAAQAAAQADASTTATAAADADATAAAQVAANADASSDASTDVSSEANASAQVAAQAAAQADATSASNADATSA
ncbi:choice-of-anchor G family protein, partial [Microbacterium suaedae]|uniref:choice-of-anchor G family protein n=1 Tax=Microbacterium suaedae TaxID=2067813 RepID=UPI000DA14995